MNPHDDHTDQLHAARTRLHALTAIVAALERREDVSAVIADSADVAAARTGLADLLDTDEAGAQAVILQLTECSATPVTGSASTVVAVGKPADRLLLDVLTFRHVYRTPLAVSWGNLKVD